MILIPFTLFVVVVLMIVGVYFLGWMIANPLALFVTFAVLTAFMLLIGKLGNKRLHRESEPEWKRDEQASGREEREQAAWDKLIARLETTKQPQ